MQHHGKQVEFDWSAQSASTIQWAAFYSDCEHEIKTIIEGDRITLTYNLYVTEARGVEIPLYVPIVDPKAFPLYEWMKSLLAGPGFMQEGTVTSSCFCASILQSNSQFVGFD